MLDRSRFQTQLDLCKAVFRVPMAVIALLPEELEWCGSLAGLGFGPLTPQGFPAEELYHKWFLAPTATSKRIMVWSDASCDPALASLEIVAGPTGVRFYARCALVWGAGTTSALGYLCIAGMRPRDDFGPSQEVLLAQFADLILADLQQYKQSALESVMSQHKLLVEGTGPRPDAFAPPLPAVPTTAPGVAVPPETGVIRALCVAVDCFGEPAVLVDVREAVSGRWIILHGNAALDALVEGNGPLGYPIEYPTLFQTVGLSSGSAKALAGEAFSELCTLKVGSALRSVRIEFRPAATPHGAAAPDAATTHQSADYADAAGPGSPTRTGPLFYFGLIRSVSNPDSRESGGRPAIASASALATESTPRSERPRNAPLPNFRSPRPSVFSDVQLGQIIGRGAYGKVYRGSWNGNVVAVKVVETTNPAVTAVGSIDSVRVKPGLFEAALSSSISHPNVASTYMYAAREASPARARQDLLPPHADEPPREDPPLHEIWIVSEFCNLGPILTAIERGVFMTQPLATQGQPNLVSILQTLQEIAAALAYLHAHDIVHGDLTGGNVLLSASAKDGRGFTAKVVDFGLSRILGEQAYLRTRTLGCAEYMPPELIVDGLLTQAGDVWAFGVILWELYMGRRAWAGLKTGEVLRLVANRRVLVFPSTTPYRLQLLGSRCLAFDPADRPTFCGILEELASILRDTEAILNRFLEQQRRLQASQPKAGAGGGGTAAARLRPHTASKRT